MASDFQANGRCLCGGVKYQITARPGQVLNCHCAMCRQAIGCNYGTFCAISHPNHFKLLEEKTLKKYQSSESTTRMFCDTCGCSLFIKYDFEHDTIWVAAGTLEGDPGINVECNIFVKYKAPWIHIRDGLPSSDEGDLWKENAGKLSKP